MKAIRLLILGVLLAGCGQSTVPTPTTTARPQTRRDATSAATDRKDKVAKKPILLHTLKGNQGNINGLAFAADGKTLATAGSDDRNIKLWEATTGKELATLKGHGDQVLGVAITANGKTVASCSRDSTVRIWDVENRKERFKLNRFCRSLAFSPDGNTLALGDISGKEVSLIDVATGQNKSSLKGHAAGDIYWVTWSKSGKILASVSSDKKAILWDPMNGDKLQTIEGEGRNVTFLAISPDDKTLATSWSDGKVRMLDLTGKQIWEIAPSDGVDGLAFSPGGKTLAAGSSHVWLHDVANGKLVATLRPQAGPVVYIGNALAYSPDGKLIAIPRFNGEVDVWDVSAWAD